MIKTSTQSIINFRTKTNIKKSANKIFSKMGIDMSSALNMFLHNVVIRNSIPLHLITDNGYTLAEEMQMISELRDKQSHIKYDSVDDLVKDLAK